MRKALNGSKLFFMDTTDVRRHFRVQVSDYAGLMQRLIPFYDEQQAMILRLIPFERNAPLRILDLGCGPGLLAAAILNEFSRAELTAFDPTEEMIESCRSRLAGIDRISYRLGDFRIDDFGNDSDLIVATLSLHHLELSERPRFLGRAHQSLKPGGSLIASEVIVDESPVVRERQYHCGGTSWRDKAKTECTPQFRDHQRSQERRLI